MGPAATSVNWMLNFLFGNLRWLDGYNTASDSRVSVSIRAIKWAGRFDKINQ